MNREITVVSVFGDSGVGKTSLTEKLLEVMPKDQACHINADYYLEDRGESLADISCDFTLLESHISQPVGTVCHYPEYDFRAFKRTGETSEWNKFVLRPVILAPFMHPFLSADLFIHLDMPMEQAVKRVLLRHPPEAWEWSRLLAEKWREIPSTRNLEAVKRLPHKLVLDATLPIEENAASAMKYITDAVEGKSKKFNQARQVTGLAP